MINEINLKGVATIVAVCGFVFGVVKFVHVQEMDAAKPYLEKKLEWCEEAVETAASIAGTENPRIESVRRFWQLYWGVMAMIEKKEVTSAMICFGNELKPQETYGELCNNPDKSLQERALAIAHACRSELASDWSSRWLR